MAYHALPCPQALWKRSSQACCGVCAEDVAAQCSTERLELAQRYCSNPQSVAVLQRQHLFSVYLHPLPDFGSFPEESIFHGREIQDRIQVRKAVQAHGRAVR